MDGLKLEHVGTWKSFFEWWNTGGKMEAPMVLVLLSSRYFKKPIHLYKVLVTSVHVHSFSLL